MTVTYTPRIAAPNEIYAYYIDRLDKYGTCQILNINQESHSLCYVTLDYLGTEPPTPEQMESMKPYYLQSFRHHHSITKSWIDDITVPRDYIYIGQCELKANAKCSSFSCGWPNGSDYLREEYWLSFDESTRSAYKKYCTSGDMVRVQEKMFRKSSDILTDSLYERLTETHTLEAFPCITSADVTGYSHKLAKWLHDTPLLSALHLKNAGVKTLDLSNTHLQFLETDLNGLHQLILPKTLISLKLYGKPNSAFRIDDSFCTAEIQLSFSMKDIPIASYGFRHARIETLFIDDITEIDGQSVAHFFPDAKYLYFTGKPGIITNLKALKQLQYLKGVYFRDLFGYDASDLEFLSDLPNLRNLDFDSIPREAGTYLRKTWKGKLDQLTVSHLRNQGWLKENLDNPLRHWDGAEEYIPMAAYKQAIKCYKSTKKQMQTAKTRKDLESMIRQYTLCFNQLNETYDEFIETTEREDIYMALQQLYEECVPHMPCGETHEPKAPLTLEEAWAIMDEVRDRW